MRTFTRYNISVGDGEKRDILIALLADWGMEGFEEQAGLLVASGVKGLVDENAVSEYLEANEYAFVQDEVADQNWNAIWESGFEPVRVEDFAGVRAAFHQPIAGVRHEIVITPKMSFGTGHHATTWLMMHMMRDVDFNAKPVFDFGTGTGILAILAQKLGAGYVLAIDNDEWCINNALENIENNACRSIEIKLADEPPPGEVFGVVLANINKHILLAKMNAIYLATAANGIILLSGVLLDDEDEIVLSATSNGLVYLGKNEKNGWIALQFQKRI
jgi:ribosomal protein L11 methyltransferase